MAAASRWHACVFALLFYVPVFAIGGCGNDTPNIVGEPFVEQPLQKSSCVADIASVWALRAEWDVTYIPHASPPETPEHPLRPGDGRVNVPHAEFMTQDRGILRVWARVAMHAAQDTARVQLCGIDTPTIQHQFGSNSRYRMATMTAVFDDALIPPQSVTLTHDAATGRLTLPTATFVAGLSLADPVNAPWPDLPSAMAAPTDPDGDDHPGVTVHMRQRDGYVSPLATFIAGNGQGRTHDVYAAWRLRLGGNLAAEDCDQWRGVATVPAAHAAVLEPRILGCELEDGGPCDLIKTRALNGFRRAYWASSATSMAWERLPEDVPCAVVRAWHFAAPELQARRLLVPLGKKEEAQPLVFPKEVRRGERALDVRTALLELMNGRGTDVSNVLTPRLRLDLDWRPESTCRLTTQQIAVQVGSHQIGTMAPRGGSHTLPLRDEQGAWLWQVKLGPNDLTLTASFDLAFVNAAGQPQNVVSPACDVLLSRPRLDFDRDTVRGLAREVRAHAAAHQQALKVLADKADAALSGLVDRARHIIRPGGPCDPDTSVAWTASTPSVPGTRVWTSTDASGGCAAARALLARLSPTSTLLAFDARTRAAALVRAAARLDQVMLDDILALEMVQQEAGAAPMRRTLQQLADAVAQFARLQAQGWALGLVLDPGFAPQDVGDRAGLFHSDAWLLHGPEELL